MTCTDRGINMLGKKRPLRSPSRWEGEETADSGLWFKRDSNGRTNGKRKKKGGLPKESLRESCKENHEGSITPHGLRREERRLWA